MTGGPWGTRGSGRREHELALFIESVVDYAIFLLDRNGHVTSWNRGAERTKGYTAGEIIGEHFSRFYTQEDIDRDHPARELEIALAEGRYEEEGWRIRKDGTRFWASVVITAIRDADGRHQGFGEVTRDLTTRRMAEERLRASATDLAEANAELEQFRLMVAGVRDYAIFLLDPEGRIATWNAGAERIKGYTAEEAVGRHVSVFYTDEDRERGHAEEMLAEAREGRFEEESWRVRKNGERFWAGVLVTAIRDDEGRLVGFAKITRDLTERRKAEQEIQSFASAAAHDLQEPLRTVSGFSELLLARHAEGLSAEGREYLEHMRSSVDRMSRLISDLLAYARAGAASAEPRPVVLRETAETVLAAVDAAVRERGARVEVDIPRDATVEAEPTVPELVLQNLLVNAIKFGAAQGPRIAVGAARQDDCWRVTVEDDGPGVPPDRREDVFEPFTKLTTDPQRGTGLGLSIALRLIERSGGSIGVEDAEGGGSRFWFTLPAAR